MHIIPVQLETYFIIHNCLTLCIWKLQHGSWFCVLRFCGLFSNGSDGAVRGGSNTSQCKTHTPSKEKSFYVLEAVECPCGKAIKNSNQGNDELFNGLHTTIHIIALFYLFIHVNMHIHKSTRMWHCIAVEEALL